MLWGSLGQILNDFKSQQMVEYGRGSKCFDGMYGALQHDHLK